MVALRARALWRATSFAQTALACGQCRKKISAGRFCLSRAPRVQRRARWAEKCGRGTHPAVRSANLPANAWSTEGMAERELKVVSGRVPFGLSDARQ